MQEQREAQGAKGVAEGADATLPLMQEQWRVQKQVELCRVEMQGQEGQRVDKQQAEMQQVEMQQVEKQRAEMQRVENQRAEMQQVEKQRAEMQRAEMQVGPGSGVYMWPG